MVDTRTIGELREAGVTFEEQVRIGESQLKQTEKGRKSLRRLKRSVGGRGGRPGKTQAQVEAEEQVKAQAEQQRITTERLKEEARQRDIATTKRQLEESKAREQQRVTKLEEARQRDIATTKRQLEESKAREQQRVTKLEEARTAGERLFTPADPPQLEAARQRRFEQQKSLEQKISEGTLRDTSAQIRAQQEQTFIVKKTATPAQIKTVTEKGATAITGRTITFSPLDPGPGEINLNPGRFITSPLILVSETIATRGGNIFAAVKELKESVQTQGILRTGGDIIGGTITSAATDPFGFVGEAATGAKLEKTLLKGVGKGKETIQFFGKPEIPATEIFDPKVLQIVEAGETKFPTTKSIEESIASFEAVQGRVTTASPTPISGEIAGPSTKGALGLEDPGIFVTPVGRGSPAFLRIQETGVPTRITFNLLTALKESLRTPTVTIFETKGIERLPREVIEKPGFEPVRKFFEKREPTGEVFITKRSEIGTGAITQQEFDLPSGRKVTEGGTKELEAVIPETQPISIGPIVGFTRVKGRKVGVRRGELEAKAKPDTPEQVDITRKKIDIDRKIILREQSELSSFIRGEKVSTPFGSTISTLDLKSRIIPSEISGFPSRVSLLPTRISDLTSSKPAPSDISVFSKGDSSFIPPGDSEFIPPTGEGSSIFTPPRDSSLIPPTGGGSSFFNLGDDQLPPPGESKLPTDIDFEGRKEDPRNLVFNVFTRIQGIPTKINKKPLPISKATELAKKETDNTLAASTELRPVGRAKEKDTRKVTFGKKFVPRKTLNALEVVERPEFRLDTLGEKKEIQRKRSLSLNFNARIF